MIEYDIDPEVRARYIREAEQMRSEAIRELFASLWTRIVQLGTWVGKRARSLGRRSRWNLSLPAPHR